MPTHLIVNSDDFGISAGVSQGIIEAHQRGIVTSTTAMLNMPDAPDAIRTAHSHAPRLGIGLHLVLSYGKPVSDPATVPSLVNTDGTFAQTYAELMAKLPHYQADDLARELQAQFDRFVAVAGRLPDHLDSHHNATYYHPDAFAVMAQLCQTHGLPMRRPDWLDGDDWAHLPTATPDFGARMRGLYAHYGSPRVPNATTDGTFFWDRRERLTPLRGALASIQTDYTELVCHVGYGAGLNEDYHIQREDELAAITHPDLVREVDATFQRITFANLP